MAETPLTGLCVQEGWCVCECSQGTLTCVARAALVCTWRCLTKPNVDKSRNYHSSSKKINNGRLGMCFRYIVSKLYFNPCYFCWTRNVKCYFCPEYKCFSSNGHEIHGWGFVYCRYEKLHSKYTCPKWNQRYCSQNLFLPICIDHQNWPNSATEDLRARKMLWDYGHHLSGILLPLCPQVPHLLGATAPVKSGQCARFRAGAQTTQEEEPDSSVSWFQETISSFCPEKTAYELQF